MISRHASHLFTPTSTGALMDPAFLRRAVADRGQPSVSDAVGAQHLTWLNRLRSFGSPLLRRLHVAV